MKQPSEVQQRLVALIGEGWRPAPLRLSTPRVVADAHHPNVEPIRLKLVEDGIVATLRRPRGKGAAPDSQEQYVTETWEKDLELGMDDGSQLTVFRAIATQWSIRSSTEGSEVDFQFSSQRWLWQRTQRTQPVVWLIELDPRVEVRPIGNVNVEVKYFWAEREIGETLGWSGVAFESRQHALVLLKKAGKRADKDLQALVVMTEDLDIQALFADFLLLRFVIGAQTTVRRIQGLDADGNVVAIRGVQWTTPSVQRYNRRSPIGDGDVRWSWESDFFSKLAAIDNRSLTTALYYYVSSMGVMLPDGLLALHAGIRAALDAAASLLPRVPSTENLSLVNEASAWAGWVETQAATLTQYAREPDAATLVEALKRAPRPIPGEVMLAQLDALDLHPTAVMRDALLVQDPIAHIAQDSDDERGAAQKNQLQALLVAIVARVSGYSGPIAGWDADRPPPLEFWQPDHNFRDRWRVDIKAELRSWIPPDIWPAFSVPEVPTRGMIGPFVLFAERLAEGTDGRVVARIVPTRPQDENDERRSFDFELVVRSLPNVFVSVFSITTLDEAVNSVRIDYWREEALVIETGTELEDFLREVSGSAEIKHQIESLMLYDHAVSVRS